MENFAYNSPENGRLRDDHAQGIGLALHFSAETTMETATGGQAVADDNWRRQRNFCLLPSPP